MVSIFYYRGDQVRIAMLHWAFPPVIGGVESHLAVLGPGLARRGWEVYMLVGSAEGVPEREEYRGVYIERSSLMDLNRLPEDISALEGDIRRLLVRFVKDVKPHIIHAHNFHYFSPVHAGILGEIKEETGIPLVLTAHNAWNDVLWNECCRLAGQWDGVIAVSGYIASELIRHGYPRDRIRVVHHGIGPEWLDTGAAEKEYPGLAGRRVIFHPARMCYDKGSHVAVKALELIAREYPDVVLVMAGTKNMVDREHRREEYVSGIMEQIKSAGLEDFVYVRHFPWEEMPFMYRRAEFCIYPSCFQEPFGLALLEAQACRKPLVVSRAGGMPEVIRDGINGFLVPMHDHRRLADRCCRLLADPGLAREMGARGYRLVKEKFTAESMVARTEEVYTTVEWLHQTN